MFSLPSLGATLNASGPTGAPVGADIRSIVSQTAIVDGASLDG